MCGIAALIGRQRAVRAEMIRNMCDVIRHRGPDGEGFALFSAEEAWPLSGVDTPVQPSERSNPNRHPSLPSGAIESWQEDERTQIALGHRRLAIVDLSDGGHQPLSDREGRNWVTYNGELYNYIELADELRALGHQFRSRSDTEVLLAAFAQWGPACLQRLNGMFSFVLFDRKNKRIFAARDRYGVKPLYWWKSPNGLLAFASEIKQFGVLPGWRACGDNQRIYDYLVWGLTDHTDRTLFDGVRQVPPGHFISLGLEDVTCGGEVTATRWYIPEPEACDLPFSEAAERFQALFYRSVEMRLRADVSVGTALSGGLDSSSIVCAVDDLRREKLAAPLISTFSARAKNEGYDEGPFIEAVLQTACCEPHMIWPTAFGLIDNLESIIWHHDEPFGSTSIYAEWCVFRAAAEASIKVTLDGHGADEILAGYTAYIGPQLGGLIRRGDLFGLIRELACQRKLHNRSISFLLGSLADDVAPEMIRNKLRRLASKTSDDGGSWIDLGRLGARPANPFVNSGAYGGGVQGLSLAQLTASSLPMQLKWTDRNSMAHGVESREPFLDPSLVSFLLGLPASYKLRKGVSKRVLREGLKQILPEKVIARRDKMGFVTPEEVWLKQECPNWTRSALADAVEISRGALTECAVHLGDDMIDSRVPFHSRVWRMICFGAWMKKFNVEGLSA